MDAETAIRIGQEALYLTLVLSGPPVIGALVVGLIVSIFQAATQIQEQTLSTVPKIVVVYGILMIAGLWAISQLIRFSSTLFGVIPDIGR